MDYQNIDVSAVFSAKVDYYDRFRWRFDSGAVAQLLQATGLATGATVVDVGAGSGLSSLPFVELGCDVFAVEPGVGMRRSAELLLGQNSNFHSLEGRAEATGLPSDIADLIVVGRALHWFPPEAARQEFLRIARPGAWLAVMAVSNENKALVDARNELLAQDFGTGLHFDKSGRRTIPLEFYFDDQGYREIQQVRIVEELWPQYLGRLCSISASPLLDSPDFAHFEKEARKVFDRFAQNGLLRIPAMTRIQFGHITRGKPHI